MVLHTMTKLERLQEELEYFEFQITISATQERADFLRQCATNSRARIAKLQKQLENEDTD